jgi:citrate lyase beta subunit
MRARWPTGTGGVIVDLEDAVAPERKAPAREGLAASFAAMPEADRQRLLVRINASGTPWHDDDRAAWRAGRAGPDRRRGAAQGRAR